MIMEFTRRLGTSISRKHDKIENRHMSRKDLFQMVDLETLLRRLQDFVVVT
jgi:hypothetical protein